jgi:hypothetical protein
VERLVRKGFDLVRDARRRQSPGVSRYNRMLSYGISARENRVEREAQIFLPWYGSAAPNFLAVHCDSQSPPEACLNGVALAYETDACGYAIPAIDLSGRLLRLELRSERPWQLKSIEFV